MSQKNKTTSRFKCIVMDMAFSAAALSLASFLCALGTLIFSYFAAVLYAVKQGNLSSMLSFVNSLTEGWTGQETVLFLATGYFFFGLAFKIFTLSSKMSDNKDYSQHNER